jgi:solute:Na+ symporter, SSS family
MVVKRKIPSLSTARLCSSSTPACFLHDIHRGNRLSSPTVHPTSANALTFLVIAFYLAAAVAIGYLVRRHADTASKYLHARGALPTAVSALSFLAANCGALEIVGIVATSAKYGALALHFYWIGAIPAMVFLALFMMPVYLRSGAMTVPDFVRIRYNDATHILCSICLAFMMVLIAGISLFAISTVLQVFFDWNFSGVAVVAASVVLCYALAGGLRATIYNEILQLTLTVAGLVPLCVAIYRSYHGVRGILSRLPPAATHLWTAVPFASPRTSTLDIFGVVFGLGVVLSFGYWCTDFVLIQRALTARTAKGAIQTPLIAAVFKLVFPWLIIFPGMAAALCLRSTPHPDFDQALPLLIRRYYGPALLGLGISAILASLMSGLAGNISAFSTLCTHDLYKGHLRRGRSDAHYLRVGRLFTVLAACLSIATAYIVLFYNDLMDYLQLVISLFSAPLFALFLLGMFTTWATPTAAFWGLLSGVATGCAHSIAVRYGLLAYGSPLLGDFYGAFYACIVTLGVTAAVSLFTKPRSRQELAGITYFTLPGGRHRIPRSAWVLACLVLAACVALNIAFR